MLLSSFGIFCQLENPTKINPLPLTSYHTTHKEEQANVWNTYSTAKYLSFHPTHEEEQLRDAHFFVVVWAGSTPFPDPSFANTALIATSLHVLLMPRDFRLQVFVHVSVSPKPLCIPLASFRI
jgi:hypothetical protein